jgi:hypothetical protein
VFPFFHASVTTGGEVEEGDAEDDLERDQAANERRTIDQQRQQTAP